MKTLIIIALFLLAGCSTGPEGTLSELKHLRFDEWHRVSTYSDIHITTGANGKDVVYSYKLGPFYNASAQIKGLRFEEEPVESEDE